MRSRRNHAFNWLTRQLRNNQIEYVLYGDTICLKHPYFYCFKQDKENPQYFRIWHPDAFSVNVTTSHGYDFYRFVKKLIQYEEMFKRYAMIRMPANTLVPNLGQ